MTLSSLPKAPPQYDQGDQARLRQQLQTNDARVLKSGQDVQLTNGEKIYQGSTSALVAHAGGGQANALVLTRTINHIGTVATAGDSVALFPAKAGLTQTIVNAGANSAQVFGQGTDTVNGAASGTGVAQAAGVTTTYYCPIAGQWFSQSGGSGGGATGATGAVGPSGPMGLGMDGIDGDEGFPIPGPPGSPGAPGAVGPAGPIGLGIDGIDGDEGFPIPGAPGAPGAIGPVGPAGPIGFGMDGVDGDEGFHIPGNPGAPGAAGAVGPQGPIGFGLDGVDGDEGFPIPGPPGPAGANGTALAYAGAQTTGTGVTDTTTPTTGGTTLTNQTMAAGSVWRVRAFGTFTAVSSGTARNASVECFWGSTALTAISVAVLVSTAQTTAWELEFQIVGTSTTACNVAGRLLNQLSSATAISVGNIVPTAVTGLTAGAQTLDLRFFMSAAVATDEWNIGRVNMERLA